MTDTSRLPAPLLDNYEWQFQGACRAYDPELFFHPDGERGSNRSNRERAAKAIIQAANEQYTAKGPNLPVGALDTAAGQIASILRVQDATTAHAGAAAMGLAARGPRLFEPE